MYIKALINLNSGTKRKQRITKKVVDNLIREGHLQKKDIIDSVDKANALKASFFDNCDVIVIAGGDGTLHNALNIIKSLHVDLPIAYLPTGTMNDFGTLLKLPQKADSFCEMVETGSYKKIDLGMVNNKYFHYVVAGGTINSISYKTKQPLKNIFGKYAYYLSAITYINKIYNKTPIEIKVKDRIITQDSMMYFVSKSPIVAGIDGLIPFAKIDDGKLHVLIIKNCSFVKSMKLLFEIIRKKHINNENIIYFSAEELALRQLSSDNTISVDGEGEKDRIMNIKVVHKAQTFLVPRYN